MAVPITPDTTVYLLKSPLEEANNHQLTFANKTAQYNYFHSLPKITCDDVSYQRRDGVIRVNEHIDNIIGYNYVMYQNTNYSNKWYYAFITNMEYVNDNVTYVSIKTDTWQTWQFDLTFKKCYVAREHVNDDTRGLHTVPEKLEYGTFVCNNRYDYTWADTNDGSVVIVFQVTTTDVTLNGTAGAFPSATYNMFNGIPQGCQVFGIELRRANMGKITSITGFYDGAGKKDAIVAITLVPKVCCTWTEKHGTGYLSAETFLVPDDSTSSQSFSLIPTQDAPTTLDGYTPKNKKLLCSPYSYLYLSNNAGADVTYRYEDFFTAPYFAVYGAFEQGGSLYCYPLNSKVSVQYGSATGDGFNEGVPAGKLPNLSWSSDYYLNWQAINGKNIAIQTTLDTLDFAGSMLGFMDLGSGGDYKGADQVRGNTSITGFARQVANTAQQIREAKMTPPQAMGNTNAGDFAFSDKHCKFTFRKMTIKAEYAKIIDDYFSAYGYQVNSYKVPNLTGRQNWNYVQTIDCNVTGNIPQDDLSEIVANFDRGITLWHNPSTFLDYSQSNNII